MQKPQHDVSGFGAWIWNTVWNNELVSVNRGGIRRAISTSIILLDSANVASRLSSRGQPDDLRLTALGHETDNFATPCAAQLSAMLPRSRRHTQDFVFDEAFKRPPAREMLRSPFSTYTDLNGLVDRITGHCVSMKRSFGSSSPSGALGGHRRDRWGAVDRRRRHEPRNGSKPA
jgi:hypothetical protein